tara:strand:- start:60 stop:326 length:267 start_codon:yes stop_codon:yes gene_type:complete
MDIKYHIVAKKIINGNNSRIRVGTNDNDITNGKDKDSFKFLKNSISSNKFKIIPSDIKISTVLKTILRNPEIKYLFKTPFIEFYFLTL